MSDGPLLFGPDGGLLRRDDQGRVFEAPIPKARVPALMSALRKSGHVGQAHSTEYDEDLKSRPKAIKIYRQMSRGHAETVGGLRRLKLPILQATDRMAPGPDIPDLPSVAATKKQAAKEKGKAKADAIANGEDPQAVDGGDDDPETNPDHPDNPEAAANLARADRIETARMVMEACLWGAWDPAYQMRTPWRRVKEEALTCIDFGAAFFERPWGYRAGRFGKFLLPDAMWFIPPETIPHGGILVDRNGDLFAVDQQQSIQYTAPNGRVENLFIRVQIPAADLVAVVHGQVGAEWDGVPVLRALHGAWRRHGYLTRVRVIDHVRRGAAPPLVELEEGWDRETKDEAEDLAERMATGDAPEQAWGVLTPKVRLKFMDVESRAPDLTRAINSEGGSFLSVFGSEFTTEGGGSLARAGVQARYFDLSLRYISDMFTGSINEQVCTPTARLNWTDLSAPLLTQRGVIPPDQQAVKDHATAGTVVLTGDVLQSIHDMLDLPAIPQELVDEYNAKPKNATPAVLPGAAPMVDKDGKPVPPGKKVEVVEDDDDEDDKKPAKAATSRLSALLRRVLRLAGPAPDSDPVGESITGGPGASADSDAAQGAGGILGVETWREPTERERRFINLSRIYRSFEDSDRVIRQDIIGIRDRLVETAVNRLRIEGVRVIRPSGSLPSKELTEAFEALAAKMRQEGRDRLAAEIARQKEAHDAGEKIGLTGAGSPSKFARLLTAAGFRRATLDVTEVVDRIDQEIASAIELNVERILRTIADNAHDELLNALLDPDVVGEEAARGEAIAKVKDRGQPTIVRTGRDISARSFNGGRAEELAFQQRDLPPELVIARVRRTEAIESKSICAVCLKMDGVVVSVDSPEFWRVQPPGQGDARCLGSTYCRGFFDAVLEAAGSAE